MGDDFYGNYQRKHTKCFSGLLSARVLGPYAVTFTMEQILHFDFKGTKVGLYWSLRHSRADHLLINLSGSKRGAGKNSPRLVRQQLW
jgi:hypothetical protein